MTGEPHTGQPELLGEWAKVGAPRCAEKYPDTLTFTPGTYRGRRGPAQGLIWWDTGIYRIEERNRLLLGVATDEIVSYEISVEGDLLTVLDSDGCRFSYRRVPQSH